MGVDVLMTEQTTPEVQPEQQPPVDPPTTYGPPSQYVAAHWPPLHDTPPRKRKLRLGVLPFFLGVAGALAIGLFGGAFIGGATSAGTKAPQVCLEALTRADEGFALTSKGFNYASDALDAASRFSVSGLNTASDGMDDVADDLKDTAPKYISARDACQAMK